jgi:AraC family transcriptional regulator
MKNRVSEARGLRRLPIAATVAGLRRFSAIYRGTMWPFDATVLLHWSNTFIATLRGHSAPPGRGVGAEVSRRFADTLQEITRIQRRPPPMLASPLIDDTLVSRAWVNDPIHSHVDPMEHHVIAPTLRGDGHSAVRFGSKTISSPSVTGGVTIAPRGFDGDFDCDGRPLAANVFLSRERLQRCSDEIDGGRSPELMPRLNFQDPKLFALLALISAEAEDPGRHERLFLEQLIDLLCIQLLRAHSAFPLPLVDRHGGLSARQLSRLTAYIRDHLDEPIGLQELADLVGLSRFYLCTAFRKATGYTPHQWLVRLRMERARGLLADRRLSITEIAFSVGYQTPSSFAHAFRAAIGITPSTFRENL